MSRKFLHALAAALLLLSITVSSVLAGEVTGNGKATHGPANANSICVFSGQNDDPTGINPEENGPPGRTQSFGQDVRAGLDPREFNPGDACRGGSNDEVRER